MRVRRYDTKIVKLKTIFFFADDEMPVIAQANGSFVQSLLSFKILKVTKNDPYQMVFGDKEELVQ